MLSSRLGTSSSTWFWDPTSTTSDDPPGLRTFTVVPKLNVQTPAPQGTMSFISKDNRVWPLDPMARRWSVFLFMKSINDSKPLTFQARLCRKYSNSIHYSSLSYGNRNKRPSFICRNATLPVRTRGYIRRQDNEWLYAVAAAPSAPTATAQKKKNRIRRRNRSRRVELSCTHLVPQLHPELPHAAPLVGADVLCRRVKASDITNHSRRGDG